MKNIDTRLVKFIQTCFPNKFDIEWNESIYYSCNITNYLKSKINGSNTLPEQLFYLALIIEKLAQTIVAKNNTKKELDIYINQLTNLIEFYINTTDFKNVDKEIGNLEKQSNLTFKSSLTFDLILLAILMRDCNYRLPFFSYNNKYDDENSERIIITFYGRDDYHKEFKTLSVSNIENNQMFYSDQSQNIIDSDNDKLSAIFLNPNNKNIQTIITLFFSIKDKFSFFMEQISKQYDLNLNIFIITEQGTQSFNY